MGPTPGTPQPPKITYPDPGAEIDDSSVNIRGTSYSGGTRVLIFINGRDYGSVLSNPACSWNFTLESDRVREILGAKSRCPIKVEAISTDDGKFSEPSSRSFTLIATPHQSPIDNGNNPRWFTILRDLLVPGGVVAIILAGLVSFILTSNDSNPKPNSSIVSAKLSAPTIISPTELDPLDSSRPTISGKANEGTKVRVYIGEYIGEAPISGVGDWSYTLTPNQISKILGNSDRRQVTLKVRSIDTNGNESGVVERPFILISPPQTQAPQPGVLTSQPPNLSTTQYSATKAGRNIDKVTIFNLDKACSPPQTRLDYIATFGEREVRGNMQFDRCSGLGDMSAEGNFKDADGCMGKISYLVQVPEVSSSPYANVEEAIIYWEYIDSCIRGNERSSAILSINDGT